METTMDTKAANEQAGEETVSNVRKQLTDDMREHARELGAGKTKIANFEMWRAARSELGRDRLRCALRAILDANEDYSDAICRDVPDHEAADAAIEERHDAVDAARAALRTDPVVAALLDIIESQQVEIELACGPDYHDVPELFDLLTEARIQDLAYPQKSGEEVQS